MTAAAVAEHPVDTAWQDMPCKPESARTARRLVRARLDAWELPQLSETAELLVSELVSNAVRHTGCRSIRVHTTRAGHIVRIGVQDSSRTMPIQIVTTGSDKDAENGRGIRLITRLSHRWGVDPEWPGKIVWFELIDSGVQ